MMTIDKVTGQRINHKANNDNAPPSYSAPSQSFKSTLQFFANSKCFKCNGTGYIGDFKNTEGGRCFKCIPDSRWAALLGTHCGTVSTDDTGQQVCEIRCVDSTEYSSKGYVVTPLGVPATTTVKVFSTIEDALLYANEMYEI
jgi:hypothetical protein